jgi:hypothetical protein
MSRIPAADEAGKGADRRKTLIGVEGPNARKRTVRNMNTGDFPGI